MSDFVGVRLGSFPHVALSILEGTLTIDSVVISHQLGHRAQRTHAVNTTLDALAPTLWIDQGNSAIDTVEVHYQNTPRETLVQVWGRWDDFVAAPESLPAILVSEMLYARDTRKLLPVGTKHRTFDELFLNNDGCIDVRALTLTFADGARSTIRAPAPRIADEFGNWDGWGVALTQAMQIASIEVDYRIASSACDHAGIRIIAR